MKQKRVVPYPFYNTDNPLLSDHANELDVFLNKPFWIWDEKQHSEQFIKTNGKCCHVDILGRPQKDGIDFPIFDYQKLIFDAIEQNMNVWILKARGIGLTRFIIYYLTWKILSSQELDHESIFIISGTREAHANYIKEKMAKLFERNFPLLNIYTKYTELVIKNTWIKVFPTTAVKDLRGYFSAKYIFVDESDYFPESVQDELIHAISPYQTKSNCKIILGSTPFKPLELMQGIELDSNSKYYKLKLPYQLGVGKIYDSKEIALRKNDVEFKREFELQYLGKVGNVFSSSQVQTCMDLGVEYDTTKIPVSLYTLKSVGVDFGFSSSSTAIVTLEHIKTDNKHIIRVIECHIIEKGDPNKIVELCWNIWVKHGYMNTAFFIDGSNASMVNLLKIKFGESLYWQQTKDFGKNSNVKVRPISFNSEHKNMLSNFHAVVSKGYLAITEKYDKLITSLRTAWAEELNLKKGVTSYDDLLDALRLALNAYKLE
jgi:hypothetical protein